MKTKTTFKAAMLTCMLYFQFASAQNIHSILVETWSGTDWQNLIQTINTFDGNNYVTNTLSESWIAPAGPWENNFQINNTNNPDGTVGQAISQSWDAPTSTWTDVLRETYTYNAFEKPLTEVTEIWVDVWMNNQKVSNTYDGSGYLTGSLQQSWDFLGSAWQNSSQNIYSNNANGTVNQELMQTWNSISWDNSARYTYTYNAFDKALTQLEEVWDGTLYVNSLLETNTYDGSGFTLNSLTQTWENGSWINDNKSDYTNNATGNPIQIINQTWNTTTSAWENSSRITIIYNSLGLPQVTPRSIVAYPNPVQDQLNVRTNAISDNSYSIIDVNGRMVQSGELLSDATVLDVAKLTSGVYLLRIGENKSPVRIIKK